MRTLWRKNHCNPISTLCTCYIGRFSLHSYWNVIIDLQMTESLDRTIAAHRKLEEDMRDSNEKKDAVAHWEAQIAEIIQWYGFFSLNWFGLLILWYF